MILVDTGPLVALFDPADSAHGSCVEVLKTIGEPLATTVPVLTEAFHLLQPSSIATESLMDFVAAGGLVVLFLDTRSLLRVFELMAQYADVPMDLADASLVSMAENHNLRTVFTIDRKDFFVYRVKRGHRKRSFQGHRSGHQFSLRRDLPIEFGIPRIRQPVESNPLAGGSDPAT